MFLVYKSSNGIQGKQYDRIILEPEHRGMLIKISYCGLHILCINGFKLKLQYSKFND